MCPPVRALPGLGATRLVPLRVQGPHRGTFCQGQYYLVVQASANLGKQVHFLLDILVGLEGGGDHDDDAEDGGDGHADDDEPRSLDWGGKDKIEPDVTGSRS